MNPLVEHILEKLEQVDSSSDTIIAKEPFIFSLLENTSSNLKQKNQLSKLVRLSKNAYDFYSLNAEQASKRPVIAHQKYSETTVITLALQDNPFILLSINTVLSKHGIEPINSMFSVLPKCSAHNELCLVLFEADLGTIEFSEVIVRALQASLEDLLIIVADFPDMHATTEDFASTVELHDQETSDFISWLLDGGAVLYGTTQWKTDTSSDNIKIIPTPVSTKGVFKSTNHALKSLTEQCFEDTQAFISNEPHHIANTTLGVFNLNLTATIHKGEILEHFVISTKDRSGNRKILSIVCTLTSHAVAHKTVETPLIRNIVQSVIEACELSASSPQFKLAVRFLASLPKTELLRRDIHSLVEDIKLVLISSERGTSVAYVRKDTDARATSALISMPSSKFSQEIKEQLQIHLETELTAKLHSSAFRLALPSKEIALLMFHVPLSSKIGTPVDLNKLANELIELTRNWQDRVFDEIQEAFEPENADHVYQKFIDLFPESYRADVSPEQAIDDIKHIQSLSQDEPLKVNIIPNTDSSQGLFNLILYQTGYEIELSRVMPVLEQAGLFIISEKTFEIPVSKDTVAFVHYFVARPHNINHLNLKNFEMFLKPGLTLLLSGEAENTTLNSLMLSAQLGIRSISVLQAYCRYMWQITKFAAPTVIDRTLTEHPWAASQLWNMFKIKFDPSLELKKDDRRKQLHEFRDQLKEGLKEVKDITQDRIFRVLISLVEGTVRTNFFQLNAHTVTFKFNPSKIDAIKGFKTFREIFVYSPHIEGIHLRTGRVSRGGLRWSDRREDFRYEVLGLVKTQRLKNALIIPTGAKGGFVLKSRAASHSDLKAKVEDAYKSYIRSLLSITDNRIDEEIVSPPDCIIYDEKDPYLVVAADKGTATFSDIANSIACNEYNFWLGDAFASGGSNGYDHKKYGITARGAWESVKRHFKDINLDYTQETFSVIGIGDMGGDVFGNGLIVSDKIKLIAAFNHIHIFIDPDPHPQKSFAERKRLFELQGSTWKDYNPQLIAQGGGVFDRNAKEISLTPQIKKALSLPQNINNIVSGEELIQQILKADVDLLWNGGIGTYVKSSSESNADVNDGTNDAVRVNALELRAKVIGEGGNLGLTQKARNEFAKNGGRINVDAIDNSGGVDLSDHEVNFKILLSALVQKGSISITERNRILADMAHDACEAVLQNNKTQALLLTHGTSRSPRRLEHFKNLVHLLHKGGYFDRTLESLPEGSDFSARMKSKKGLLTPELGVIFPAVKMWLKDELLKSDLIDDPLLEIFLTRYFPESLCANYREEIREHPLRRDITATQITNRLVDTMGATFVYRTAQLHNVTPIQVVRYYLATRQIFNMAELKTSLSTLDTTQNNQIFINALQETNRAMRESVSWLFLCHGNSKSLTELVDWYKEPITEIIEGRSPFLLGIHKKAYKQTKEMYAGASICEQVLRSITIFSNIRPLLGIIWAAKQTGIEIEIATQVYRSVMSYTRLHTIFQKEEKIQTENNWERALLFNSFATMRIDIFTILVSMLKSGYLTDEEIKAALQTRSSSRKLLQYIREVKNAVPSVSAAAVIAQQLSLCSKE